MNDYRLNNYLLVLFLFSASFVAGVPEGLSQEAVQDTDASVHPVETPCYRPVLQCSETDIIRNVFIRFPDADATVVMEFLEEQFSQEMEEFKKNFRWQPGKAAEILTGLILEALELLELKNEYPDYYDKVMLQRKLEKEAETLAEECRRSTGEKKEILYQKLKKTIIETFVIKQLNLKMQAERMAAELAELNAFIDNRNSYQEQIIDNKLKILTGQRNVLSW